MGFDVGGVAGENIAVGLLGKGGEPCALGKLDACAELLGVVAGYGKGFVADVAGVNGGIGAFEGGADGDDAAACTQVPQFALWWQVGKGGFEQKFGFGAGNQDGGGDVKGAAIKFALADEIGDGFACAAALGELFETGKGVGCDGVLAVADGLAVCPVLDGLNEYAAFVARQLAMVLPFGVAGLGHGVVMGLYGGG